MLSVLDLLGVFFNALLGGIVARGARLDLIGFVAIAVVSGLGGGLLRDTLLQAGTPVALTNPEYIVTAMAGALFAFLAPIHGRAWEYSFVVVDALALGCWAVTGASKTLGLGLGLLPALLLGMTTAVGGGAIRDVLMQRIPSIFGGNTLYASAALAASGVLAACWSVGEPTAGSMLGTATGAGLCLLARRLGWVMPEAYSWRIPRLGLPRPRLRRARAVVRRVTRPRRPSAPVPNPLTDD